MLVRRNPLFLFNVARNHKEKKNTNPCIIRNRYKNWQRSPLDRRLYCPAAARMPTVGGGRRTVGATGVVPVVSGKDNKAGEGGAPPGQRMN